MPNFIIFDPTSSPVANRVIQYRRSVSAVEMDGVPNTIRYDTNGDPPEIVALAGIPQSQWKVDAGVVVAMSAADIQAIADARAATELAGLKTNAKQMLSRDRTPQERAFKQSIETVLELVVQEINILRAEHSLTPRTADQVKSAFVTSYEAKIDAITEP